MNKLILTALTVCFALSSLSAKNLRAKVDRSGGLWWNAPSAPALDISLTDTLQSGTSSSVKILVSADTLPSKTIFEKTFKITTRGDLPETISVPLTLPAPGFYKCHILDDGNVIYETNIGYEPTNVVSLPDAQPDMAEFWEKAKSELAEVPAGMKLTRLENLSGASRDIYDCTFQSWGGDTIKARVAIPKKPGRYPVIIYYNGYGAKPWDLDPDAKPEWIEMQTSVRGQLFCEKNNRYGDWIRHNIDNPDKYYYKGAYLDATRAVDIAGQLPYADNSRIYAEGGSQGGALTLAAAALSDGKLRAIAPYIPFMSDFPDYFRIVSWPATAIFEARDAAGMTDEQLYRNLSYFDIKNLARMITCPVLMGIGLQDPVCPPHTNVSSYNLLEVPKELRIYTDCEHTVDYNDWNPRRDAFFQRWR